MSNPIRKTGGNTPAQRTQASQTPKKREYAVGPDGKRTDVTSVFEQIDRNTAQDQKDHDKFMQDMFGDVLPGKSKKTQTPKKTQTTKKAQSTKKTQATKTPKKREYAVGPDGRRTDVTSVFEQIDKNTEQDQKDHDKFMQDMFGDVLD